MIHYCFANSGLGWKMRCLIFISLLFFVRSCSSSPDYSYDDDYDYDYEGERNNFIKQREYSNYYFQIHFSGSGNQGPGKYTFACSTPDEEVQGIVETIVD